MVKPRKHMATTPSAVEGHPYYPILMNYINPAKVEIFKKLDDAGKLGVLSALSAMMNTGFKNMRSQGRKGDIPIDHPLQYAFEKANPEVQECFDDLTLDAMQGALGRFMTYSNKQDFIGRMEELRDKQFRRVGNPTMGTDTKATVKKPQSGTTLSGDYSNFESIKVKDLKIFEVNRRKKLTGTLVSNPGSLIGINTMLEDADGNCVELGLYNQVEDNSYETVDKVFPKGRSITIIEPYLKIFNSGTIGIRVDSPTEIIFNDAKVDGLAGLATAKKTANEFVVAKNYRTALSMYEEAIKKSKDIDLVTTLLSNRAQAFLKIGCPKQALWDAAAALLLRPAHTKSKQRYDTALQELEAQNPDAASSRLPLESVFTDITYSSLASKSTLEVLPHKDLGNTHYQKASYEPAIAEYSKALNHPSVLEVAYILSNLSMCYLKTGLYESAFCASAAVQRFATKEQTVAKSWHRVAVSCIQMRRFNTAEVVAKYINDAEMAKAVEATLEHAKTWSLRGPDKKSLTTTTEAERMDVAVPQNAIPEYSLVQWVHPSLTIKRVEGKGRGVVCNRRLEAAVPVMVDIPLVVVKGEAGKVEAGEKTRAGNTLMFLNTRDRYTSEMLNNLTPGSQDMPVVQFPSLLRKPKCTTPLIIEDWSADRTCETYLDDILQHNSFGTHGSLYLFPMMSMLNHSSTPNATIMQVKSGTTDLDAVILFPTKEIKAGTELTIEYSSSREALRSVWGIPA